MPGVTASLISGWPNLALSAAMMKSRHHRQLAAAAQGVARHRRYPRLARGGEPRIAGEEVRPVHVGEGLVRHLLDVRSGGEGAIGAGDHRAALRGIGVVGGEGGGEVRQNLAVEGVQSLGPVEPDQGDGVVRFYDQGLKGHRVVSFGVDGPT